MRKCTAPTVLETAITEFMTHQRVFGCRYRNQEWTLKQLGRFVARHGAADLSAPVFEQWCKSHRQLSPTTRYVYQLLVRKFCLYRRRRDLRCFVPDPSGFARPQPYRPPVIVTPAQVTAMLRAVNKLTPGRDSPLRQPVMRLAVVLLYTAGLRPGELVRLQVADVDSQDGVLHIRKSKFHRSRWVPLSSSARRELRAYLRKRLRKPYDRQPTAPLFCNDHPAFGRTKCHRYSGRALSDNITSLFDLAGVRDTQGRRPRAQDMRHSFAVQALLRWYRHGEDVQTQLPKLSLYMGHVSIISTAYYLHFIPEVATLASKRFDRGFSHLIDSGVL